MKKQTQFLVLGILSFIVILIPVIFLFAQKDANNIPITSFLRTNTQSLNEDKTVQDDHLSLLRFFKASLKSGWYHIELQHECYFKENGDLSIFTETVYLERNNEGQIINAITTIKNEEGEILVTEIYKNGQILNQGSNSSTSFPNAVFEVIDYGFFRMVNAIGEGSLKIQTETDRGPEKLIFEFTDQPAETILLNGFSQPVTGVSYSLTLYKSSGLFHLFTRTLQFSNGENLTDETIRLTEFELLPALPEDIKY